MNNSLVYIICASFMITFTLMPIACAQENSSSKWSSNNTLPDDIPSVNTSSSTLAYNNTPTGTESMNNNKSIIASANLSAQLSNQFNDTFFTVGFGEMSNESAYDLDAPTSPAKNASNLWYIIQATPHGYT
jgi:hypothetical protein